MINTSAMLLSIVKNMPPHARILTQVSSKSSSASRSKRLHQGNMDILSAYIRAVKIVYLFTLGNIDVCYLFQCPSVKSNTRDVVFSILL